MTDVYSLNYGTTVGPLPGPRQHWNLLGIEERANGTMLQAGKSPRGHRGPSRGHCPGQMVLWCCQVLPARPPGGKSQVAQPRVGRRQRQASKPRPSLVARGGDAG